MPSNLATMQQQILRLFQTVLDASITDVDFSIRVQAYEQAPSLQKFDFQPMKISFEFVDEKQFAEKIFAIGESEETTSVLFPPTSAFCAMSSARMNS